VARWAVLTVDTGPAGFSAPAESSAPGGFPAADGSSAPAGLPARDGLSAPGGAPACRTLEDVLERASDELRAARDAAGHRPVVARVEFVGASSAADALTDPERLREELGRIAAPLRIALQKITVRVTHPEPPASIDPDLIAAIEAASAGLRADTERLLGLAKPLDGEVGRLLRTADLLDLRNPETLADIANRAGAGLLARLAGETN
jgi:hypothetical protein